MVIIKLLNIAGTTELPYIKRFNDHTEKKLIQLWQKGNEVAFGQLYHNHAIDLLTIAFQKTNDREVSKELVQKVFIALHNNKESAHQINSLRAYLYTILKHRILDHFRKKLVEKKLYDRRQQMYVSTSENDADAYVQTKELESLLSEEISKLPPQCQIVFRMRREHDLSNMEIARLLNISVNTVEQHMRKAIRILKIAFNIGKKAMLLLYLLRL